MHPTNDFNYLISIIVPVYNSEKSIERCILSILNQKYSDFELILVDDGSSDNSRLIIEKYTKIHKNVKYFYKNNNGPSSARNIGILYSDGKYIMFVDSDDYLKDGTLQTISNNIEKNNYDMILFNYENNKNCIIKQDCFFDFIVLNRLWAPWGKVVKKSAIKKMFNESSSIGEDLKFWYDNRENIKRFLFIDEKLYIYEINANSLMHSKKINSKILAYFEDLYFIIKEIKCTDGNCYDFLLLCFFNSYIENKRIDNLGIMQNSNLIIKYNEIYHLILKSPKINISTKVKIFLKNKFR